MSDINSIISGLQKINEDQIEEFTLPASGVTVSLKPFQAKHNSMVNSSVVAGSDGTYTLKFYQLLKEVFDDILTIEAGKSYKDIPMVDVHYLILKVRQTFNKEVTLNISSKDEVKVEIDPFLKRFEVASTSKPIEVEIKEGDMIVKLKQPSFMDCLRYDNILIAAHEKFAKDDSERLIKDALAFTLLKFIDVISVKVDNEQVDTKMGDLSPSDQRKVIDNIPNQMYKNIMNGVKAITDPIEELIKHDEDNSLVLDQTIFIDL